MPRKKDNFPAPPDLPSFRVEADAAPREAKRSRGGGGGDGDGDGGGAAAERHVGTSLIRHDALLEESLIDSDAAKVVRRLERSGFQAYLVGGCVRDLLLGSKPKDYDIATSARPEDVRSIFRNCRIIGRRFRLAHVLFGGGKVIEVATFRKSPPEVEDLDEDLLIRNDNLFGEAHEDAIRRDFTINALFYDLDRRQVLDWCGGMEDVRRRTIRTIGEPSVRFREDPVRILRAVKFAARLDLGIEPAVWDAMVSHRHELAKAARPRIFEEVLRLMRGGGAHRSMWILWESGCLAVLLPELAAFLDDEESNPEGVRRFWRSLDEIDRRTKRSGPQDDVVLVTVLLREPLEEALSGVKDKAGAFADFIDVIVERMAVPRRIADSMRRIIGMLPRIAAGRVGKFAKSELMAPATLLLEIDRASR
jgi:poly(A) polymerase